MQTIIREELEYKNNLLLMDWLNNYISKVDSEWPKKIEPSNYNDLTALVNSIENANMKLPNSFIEFAKIAGENDGGLLSKTLRGQFSISDLIDCDEEYCNEYGDFSDENYFEFLTGEVGMGYEILLDDENYGKIYYEDTCFISSSFEKLLFQCAVQQYEERFYSTTTTFSSSINSLKESTDKRNGVEPFEIMDEICNQYNLKKSWFSDDYFYFAYSDKLSIILLYRQLNNSKSYIAGKISGNDEEMDILMNHLGPQIGAKIQRVFNIRK